MQFSNPTFNSVNAATIALARELLTQGKEVAPRGCKTLEISNVCLSLQNPRARLTTLPTRRWNYALALGELCWHAAASDSVEALAFYAGRWKEFSEDGVRITGSCYGKRIFGKDESGTSQWDRVHALFSHDPGTRRAVLYLNEDGNAHEVDSMDVSCTSLIQFFIRENRLNASTYMRSNDVIWGFPYDCFLFSFLQELLATELGLRLGIYTHIVGSMHAYERHYPLLRNISETHEYREKRMIPMDDPSGLAQLVEFERQAREGHVDTATFASMSSYWRELADVIEDHAFTRKSRTAAAE